MGCRKALISVRVKKVHDRSFPWPFTRQPLQSHNTAPTSPTITREQARWTIIRAISLPEVWAIVAAFSGLVGVCRVACAGLKDLIGTLPRLVVCGGYALVNGKNSVSGTGVNEVSGLQSGL